MGQLNTLNPLATLERGYSVSFNEQGEIVKDARQISVGDVVRTRLHKGSMVSKITDINP
jgi:exodeoxyribonuclease VII large subunit